MVNLKINLLFIFACIVSCSPTKETVVSKDDGLIEIQFLQINDVYEIAPLPGDNRGGLARIATLKKQYIAENKNTIAIMAGDFLSPSVIGTLNDKNGNGIKGAHIIDIMNISGIDIATFGNHEFDIKDCALLEKRLAQSDFQYTVCNATAVLEGQERAFLQGDRPVPEYLVHEIPVANGAPLRLGLLGVFQP